MWTDPSLGQWAKPTLFMRTEQAKNKARYNNLNFATCHDKRMNIPEGICQTQATKQG